MELTKTQRKNVLISSVNSNTLELIVFPTEKCNFRCVYCYEDFTNGRMPPEIVSGIKNLISNRGKDLKILKLEWFGGEPLLAYDIILDILAHANSKSIEYGFRVISGVTTNGYFLDKEKFLHLFKLGVLHYQVSLDGDEEIHNETRKLLSGENGFFKIWNNMKTFSLLKRNGLLGDSKILLRLHAHNENIDSLIYLIEKIKNNFSNDDFTLLLKPIGKWGGPGNDSVNTINESDDNLSSLYAEVSKFNKKTLSVDDIDICYAAKPNAFSIRSNGNISKCTVALNSNKNIIGKINPDGTLELDMNKLKPWNVGVEKMDVNALRCPLNFIY